MWDRVKADLEANNSLNAICHVARNVFTKMSIVSLKPVLSTVIRWIPGLRFVGQLKVQSTSFVGRI